MKTVVNTNQNRRCVSRSLPLEQLSEADLQQRKIAAEEMLAVVGLLGILVIIMAFWSGLYPLALTSIGMQPAFSDYLAQRRAIINQLNKQS